MSFNPLDSIQNYLRSKAIQAENRQITDNTLLLMEVPGAIGLLATDLAKIMPITPVEQRNRVFLQTQEAIGKELGL